MALSQILALIFHFYTAGALALAVFFCVGCAQTGKGRIYLIDEYRQVVGQLINKNGFDPNNAEFSLINESGQRATPRAFQFDRNAMTFSFSLEDSDFYDAQFATLMERILSMGNALPLVGILDANSFSRIERFTKFEIRPAKFSSEKIQKVPYLQVAIPLAKRNLYSSRDNLNFASALEVSEAVFVKVQVVGEDTAPLAGVDVAAVSYSRIQEGVNPFWHLEGFRPVFTKTDKDGFAMVGPILPNELQAYHILFRGENICTYVSMPKYKYKPDEELPVLTARTCQAGGEDTFALTPSFPEGLKYFDVKNDSIDRPVVHINQPNIYLRLDSLTDNLRGYKLEVFETNSAFVPYGEPESVVDVPFFESEVIVDLPKIFKVINDEKGAGKFQIRLTEKKGGRSNGAADAEARQYLIYGERRLTPPARDEFMKIKTLADNEYIDQDGNFDDTFLDYWVRISIKGETGAENLVSGLVGSRFTISSSVCKDGDEIGFEVNALGISKRFAPCIDGVGTFTAESAGFVEKYEAIVTKGGRQEWRVFIKDKFGNESEGLYSRDSQSSSQENHLTVIIDTAKPKIGAGFHELSHVAFEVYDDETDDVVNDPVSMEKIKAGKVSFFMDSDITNEPCIQQVTGDAAQVNDQDANGGKGSNVAVYNGDARHSHYLYKDELGRVVAVEGSEFKVGARFVRYAIGSTKAAVDAKPVSEFTRCRKLSDPADLTSIVAEPTVLTEDHIAFPEDTALPAEFYLRVQDAAGNLSETVKFELPACTDPSNPTPSPCWAPAPPPSP